MNLKVIAPDKTLFLGEVQCVKLPGSVGQFMVLEHHAPLVSTLCSGEIIYRINGKDERLRIEGGVVEVRNNQVVVCIN